MRIAQVYPHSVISVPRADVYDALAIVNYELGRRLARAHTVVTYPKWARGQPQIETYEGVTYRRIPETWDGALNLLKVLDNRLLTPERPFRLSSWYYASYAHRVARDIRRRQCDLVHVHSISNFLPVLRRANPNARLVLHMHDHSLSDFDPAVVAPRLRHAALILGCSDFVINAIRSRFPQVADRCHALHNGVDERFLQIESDPARSDAVLFVGRLCPEKGVHVLLEALSRLPAGQSYTVNVVGPLDVAPKEFVDPFSKDPLFKDLQSFYERPQSYRESLLTQVNALAGRAVLHGKVFNKEIGAHYARAGIFVFPSLWHEPFGIPVIEAMAAGLPVVATRGGALPEVVVDGETGFLVDRGDAAALNAAIATLLSNPDLRARMGAAGRERVRKLFTWDRCVTRLQELYGASGATVSGQSPLGLEFRAHHLLRQPFVRNP